MAIEVRAAGRRVFRLSRQLGPEGVCLGKPAPFEPGRPVEICFRLPDGDDALTLRARLEEDTRDLTLIEAPTEARQALAAYVARRLGLPYV